MYSSLYSSTVERNTVNILIDVRFILSAMYKEYVLIRVSQMVRHCVSATKITGSSLVRV